MEDLKDIWEKMDQKLQESRVLNWQSWALNLRWFETMQTMKAQSTLNKLASFKIRAAVLGMIWLLLLVAIMKFAGLSHPYFFFSIGGIAFFTAFSTGMYIRQAIAIKKINFERAITSTQEDLAKLQAATINSTRVAWLQLPFYFTFSINKEWVTLHNWVLWVVLLPLVSGSVALAIYIYKNMSAGNLNKRWVRYLLMSGPEYRSIIKAKEFVGEVEAFKKELLQ